MYEAAVPPEPEATDASQHGSGQHGSGQVGARRALVLGPADAAARTRAWREETRILPRGAVLDGAAPTPDSTEEEIAAYLGPYPSPEDVEDFFSVMDWLPELSEEEDSQKECDLSQTSPVVGGGWELPPTSERLPVGVAPLVTGKVADVGHLARTPATAATMADLLALDVDATDPYTLIEAIAAWRRVESQASYHVRTLAAELAKRPQVSMFKHPELDAAAKLTNPVAATEISFRLGVTRQQATAFIDAGTTMTTGSGICTGDALSDGVIDARKADVLISSTKHLPAELSFDAQNEALDLAPGCTVPQLQRHITRIIANLDPEDHHTRHRRARQ